MKLGEGKVAVGSKSRQVAIWAVVALFAVFNVAKPFVPASQAPLVGAATVLLLTAFVLAHGSRHVGWKQLGVLFVIAFVISWCYESLSIATGFPFGNYYYTDKLGPKLGTVPLLIMPAYYAAGFLSWNLAKVVLDRFHQRADAVQTWATPAVAAFIMCMWDMSMDPARATNNQVWVWEDGGPYFGVPFANFMGWLLCVWTIFQVFALYLRRGGASAGVAGTSGDTKTAWFQIVAMYAALMVEFLSFAAFPPSGTVTDETGVTWRNPDIYQSLGLVAIFTMLFVVLLSTLKISLTDRIAHESA